MSTSILDDLGQEVTGIVAPVSICMFLTVLLVRLLNPDGISNPSAVAIAQTFYKEQVRPRDSTQSMRKLHSKFLQQIGAAIAPGGLQCCEKHTCLPLQDSDSTGTKFEGALVNALIFVVIVGAMTFVLFLLFKYKVRQFFSQPLALVHT